MYRYMADRRWRRAMSSTAYTTTLPAFGQRTSFDQAIDTPRPAVPRRRRTVAWHWTRWTSVLAWPIVVVLVGLAAVSVPFAPKLLARTTAQFDSASSSPSKKGSKRLEMWFPGTHASSTVMLIETTSVLSTAYCKWELNLTSAFKDEFGTPCQDCFVRAVTSACQLRALNAIYIADLYSRQSATMLQISYDGDASRAKINEMLEWLSDREPPPESNARLGVTGEKPTDVCVPT